jgi:phosphohistidine phosphatase
MRLLTLVRHAKASKDNPELADFERPLDPRGRKEALEMAERLAAELEEPLKLVSSPALRALATAQTFADALGVAHKDIERDPRIYEATPGTLLEVARGFSDQRPHVVMFGHNPGFSDFARVLVTSFPTLEMQTCSAATIELGAASWSQVGLGNGRLRRYRHPKEH